MNITNSNPVIRPKTSILDKSPQSWEARSIFISIRSPLLRNCSVLSVPKLDCIRTTKPFARPGWEIGARCLDLILIRDRPSAKREIKLLNVLLTVKVHTLEGSFWEGG
ncbi:TRAPPC5 [Lepeophtheirus salmonis]|uniref:TRAPPC5 n=1 Tax=Lepeophtheirus salmonis TaxID=72036 RepID=A0A7R8CFN8_LEPSM|nr:TRAPPC5 [Lepeophtheirus salmonis]CAF2802862.1 TRAPPC5 [Lepeophtheirus salmonis]